MENRFKIILDKGNKVRQSRHSADRVDEVLRDQTTGREFSNL